MQRMMASKTVEVGVITYGNTPDKTNNYLNQTQGGYEGVNEVVEMGRPSTSTLSIINSISEETDSSENGDIIDGIVVAQDILVRSNQGKAFNRVMIIFTDGETRVEGLDDLEPILKQMRNVSNFGLHIFLLGKVLPSSTVVKRENSKLLKSIADNVNGRYTEVECINDCFRALSSGLGLGTRPRVSKIPLELSPNVVIPCALWSKISEAKLPSLKKEASGSKGAAAKDEDDDGDGDEPAARGVVKRDTTYRNPNDPDQEIGADEKVKGYRYGSQYIPMTAVDEKMFKIRGPAVIQLLGFVSTQSVPRQHCMDSASLVHGAADSESADKAVVALAVAMDRSDKVAIVRYVKSEDADPYLAGLWPISDAEVGWSLLLYRLPCAEDVREYAFPSLNHFASAYNTPTHNSSSYEKVAAVSSLVDSLTVRKEGDLSLTPINPTLHTLLAEVHRRIVGVDPSQVLPLENPLVPKIQASPSVVSAITSNFQLVKTVAKAGKKKVFWSDIELKSTSADGSSADSKRVKYEIDAAFLANNPHLSEWQGGSVGAINTAEQEIDEQLANLPTFSSGSVSPIDDFQALLTAVKELPLPAGLEGAEHQELFEKKKKDVIEEAVRVMTAVIECTVGCSTQAHYRRAIACLQLLRTTAMTLNYPSLKEIFNTFLMEVVKPQYGRSGGRHYAVWHALVNEKITLIEGNGVSKEDMKKYLEEGKVEVVEEKTTVADDDDDLFEIMA
eukprot:CAMPEP_0170071728 /NCGR_PEP_ID=MMETSP0019_2-20121128/9566_1 /TAXON_ID=98059 /ORGANISM="Dinobryon sp., Strain UTEXLB2267" /LENGTH=728 /DNA_ID=CAMNT_0010280389 /DNA_START=84 /DNA_END=2270 /DNA_ORIENTATION=+